jgi:hypothetical protein
VLPLLVLTATVSTILVWLMPPQLPGGETLTFGPLDLLVQLVLTVGVGLLSVLASGAIFARMAGMFGGDSRFNAGLTLVGLAATPYYLASCFATLPGLGMLLLLVAFFVSLVLLYKGVPVILRVPEEHRAKHFALCVVAMLFLGLVMFSVLAGLMAPTLAAPIPAAPVAGG